MGHITNWLTKPLCRRYVAVLFSSNPATGSWGEGGESGGIVWAIGTLTSGDSEILGVWRAHADTRLAMASVFGDVHERGAEFIRFGIGDLVGVRSEFKQIYKTAELFGSVEQALEQVGALLPPRHRLDVLSCLRDAAEAESLEAGRSVLARFQGSVLGRRYPRVVRRWDEALESFASAYSLDAQLRGIVRLADRTAADVRGRLQRAILRHGRFTDSAAELNFVAATLARVEQQMDRDRAIARPVRQAESMISRGALRARAGVGVPTLAQRVLR